MLLIIAILIGIVAGQFVKIQLDHKLTNFARHVWAWLLSLDIPRAIEWLRMGPLQRRMAATFDELEAEALVSETYTKAVTSMGKVI
jgi:hypothetical protein